MRYIDKYRMHDEAHAINVQFLKDCYSGDVSNPYPSPASPDSSYDNFKKAEYRDGANGWKNLLLAEQTVHDCPRCCYCMRRLNPSAGRINYEHVVPRTLRGADGKEQFRYYASHAPALNDHIMLADEFVAKQFQNVDDIANEERMPHTTGLSNLLVACNGKRNTFVSVGCCCNWSRSDNKIMPLMLMDNVDSDVKYDQNGIMSISKSSDDGTLDIINKELNDETLQEIRSVWYHLSRVAKDVDSAASMSKIERINWFKAAYNVSDFTLLPDNIKRYSGIVFPSDDTYWNLLLAYDWFYYYPGYAIQRNANN